MVEIVSALIIGGGFYGMYLADYLAARLPRVLLCEQQSALMQRASYANQARVHNGYHYPRSVLTAVRSRVNFPRFVGEFRPAIDSSFRAVYAIGRRFSKVTPDQFYGSMRRIGAPLEPAPENIAALFDRDYIAAAFLATEYAFDANVLRNLMADRVRRAGVEVRLNTTVHAVRQAPDNAVEIELTGPDGTHSIVARQVFCCAYSQLNRPGAAAGLPQIPLKHELAELALVEVPSPLRGLGVTVMDGPYFSLMPFPATGLHTLSHVRYTPHLHWYDGGQEYVPASTVIEQTEKRSAFPHMVRDAARYLPAAAECTYRDSLWEVKTVLPRSENDDSRPILFKPNHGLPNYHVVMGGKIDNVYDVADVVGRTFGWS